MTTTGHPNYFGGYSSYGYGQNQASSYLMNLQDQLRQGVIPSLDTLVDMFPQTEPESPEAQALMARTIHLLHSAGPQGDTRAKQLAISMADRSLNNVSGSLFTILGNLEPESPEAQQIQARLAAIQAVDVALDQQLAHSLNQDPTHGGDIHLNQGYNNGFGNIFSMMIQMMQQMLSMFRTSYGGAAA